MNKMKNVLSVMERTDFGSGSSRKSRREGKIPGILYGHGKKATPYLLVENEWKKILQHGNIHLVELKSEKGDAVNALVKDVQFDYLNGKTLHVDFLEVKMDELITTSVDVIGHGTPVGIIQGGVLEQLIHKMEIRCLPKDIPESIEVEITGIELDKGIHVNELKLPEGVTAVPAPDSIVFHVIRLRIEEEATATAEGAVAEGAEGAAAEPEVVGAKGKKLEEGEEAEGAAGKDKASAKDAGGKEKEKKK
ncbi:MAG: 50S ribosomal protein L25 [Victivallales bacterium]